MDTPLDIETLSVWFTQYGSLTLFALLALGIIAFPIPEETLLVLSGALVHRGNLNMVETALAAYAGSICGITISYLIGNKAGNFFIIKVGSWFGLTTQHLDRAHSWFKRFGKWTLFIGYFIPGVRHFTGISAGISSLAFKEFALFAYSGAIFWVTSFLSIGYFFGHHGLSLYERLEMEDKDIVILIVLAVLTYLGYLLYKKKKQNSIS